MKVNHGACGQSWNQKGNRTGHCSGCHLNFSGNTAFDAHQKMVGDKSVCTDPSTLKKYESYSDDIATYWRLIDTTGYFAKLNEDKESV